MARVEVMAARVHQIADEGLGNTSYLVEVAAGTAVSVDPPRDVATHLTLAQQLGARIAAVLETHVHADFVTGVVEIADATGATIHAAAAAQVGFPHSPVRPDDVLPIGDVTFRVVGTPGHTPEHLAFVLEEEGRPTSVFSGGSLIAGGAARTDLSGEDLVEPLTRAQFRSMRAIASLPDEVALHPTHGGGSFCSSGSARRAATTIWDERRHNELLRIDDEDAFVARFSAELGSFPSYFLRLPPVNRAGPALVRSLDEPGRLPPEEAAAALERGAVLIDGRSVEAWAREHARGAISITIRPQFATWLGWVVPFGAAVVVIADDAAGAEAARQASTIGYDGMLGWLGNDAAAWAAAGLATTSTPLVGPEAARAMGEGGAAIVDVRQSSEWNAGRIPGARHVELGDVIAGKAPEHGSVVTYCSHGERSATAASLLERRGVDVANLAGGITAWKGTGLPVER